MAQLNHSSAALRIFGDTLQPNEITQLLGHAASESWVKGHSFKTHSGHTVTRRTGAWILNATKSEPANLNEQVSEILGKLSVDSIVWNSISQRFGIDLFCGLFMEESNEGLSLSPVTLQALAERKIEVSLDIYGPDEGEIANDDLCPCGSGKKYGECCAPKSSSQPPSSNIFNLPSAG